MAPSRDDAAFISHYREGACAHLTRPHRRRPRFGTPESEDLLIPAPAESGPAAARLADRTEPGGHRPDAIRVLGRHVLRLAEVLGQVEELVDGGDTRLGGRVSLKS